MTIKFTSAEKKTEFQKQILYYWDCCGRKKLPWRKTRDGWHILITEILLRKTTAQQAISVFDYFASMTPEELSTVDEDELKSVLFKLGMYKIKSLQIRRIARIVSEAGRESLRDDMFLENLPGIGRYIKNSVLCFAFGEQKPALDTNMIRVIQRVFSYRSKRSRPREDPDLWNFAEELVPTDFPREYNWGVLDLASAVCKPRNPICHECPLENICDFYNSQKNLTEN